MPQPPRIVVIGSVNMDLVATVDRLPRAGETTTARGFATNPGGKGANQAVAAARLGATVDFIGCVGDDGFGEQLRRSLESSGVGCGELRTVRGVSSGTAWIHVDRQGENSITVVPGANAEVTPGQIEAARKTIARADRLLVQLEIPLETVLAAVESAGKLSVPVVLDPAPAPAAPRPRLCRVDVLTPNETEAERLVDSSDLTPSEMGRALKKAGAARVVLKRGANGALMVDETGQWHEVSAFAVDAVDSTGAGDAFTAALAVRLAAGDRLADAVRFGCAAGALAATRHGAQQAMPSLDEVKSLLDDQCE